MTAINDRNVQRSKRLFIIHQVLHSAFSLLHLKNSVTQVLSSMQSKTAIFYVLRSAFYVIGFVWLIFSISDLKLKIINDLRSYFLVPSIISLRYSNNTHICDMFELLNPERFMKSRDSSPRHSVAPAWRVFSNACLQSAKRMCPQRSVTSGSVTTPHSTFYLLYFFSSHTPLPRLSVTQKCWL